jgi:hypothetical protein
MWKFQSPFSIHHPLRKEKVLLGLLNQKYIKSIFCQYKNEIVKSIFFRGLRGSRVGIDSDKDY